MSEAELQARGSEKRKPQENLLKTGLFLDPFERAAFDCSVRREYASIRAEFETHGKTIGPNDLMIAATAKAHGATLVTNNVREFERVPGLKVESWALADRV